MKVQVVWLAKDDLRKVSRRTLAGALLQSMTEGLLCTFPLSTVVKGAARACSLEDVIQLQRDLVIIPQRAIGWPAVASLGLVSHQDLSCIISIEYSGR